MNRNFYLSLASLLLAFSVKAQDKPLEMKMDFEEYDPPSSLVVPEHHLTKAKFPFIDIHNHQRNMNAGDLNGLIKDMDKMNMAVMVNLSGQGFPLNPGHLKESMESITKN